MIKLQKIGAALTAAVLVSLGHAQTFTWAGTELDAAEAAVTGVLAIGGVLFVGYALYHMVRRAARKAQSS